MVLNPAPKPPIWTKRAKNTRSVDIFWQKCSPIQPRSLGYGPKGLKICVLRTHFGQKYVFCGHILANMAPNPAPKPPIWAKSAKKTHSVDTFCPKWPQIQPRSRWYGRKVLKIRVLWTHFGQNCPKSSPKASNMGKSAKKTRSVDTFWPKWPKFSRKASDMGKKC